MAEKVIVIGAGPAGLMAALTAASRNREVLVLEYLSQCGRKLLASGAGKCNFTNMLSAENMAERFAFEQRRFIRPALLNFTPGDVRRFFAEHNVPYKLVDDFYCFPESEKAGDILQVLLDAVTAGSGKILCDSPVTGLDIENDLIKGVYCKDEYYPCDYLIAAGGGPGFPRLGGRCSLDKVFSQHNISMIERTAALCGIKSKDLFLQDLAGVVLDNTELLLDKKNKSSGTLLFTGDGISGPVALDLAGRVAKLLKDGRSVTLRLNFSARKSRTDWLNILENARKENGKRLIHNLFDHHLPQSVAFALVQKAGSENIIAANLPKAKQELLLEFLTACPINVSGVESWDKSMASTGGADRNAINSKTMQSKEIENLYFAGEFIDVDGPCGGYNIQWALSSGRLAGMLKKSNDR